MKIKNSFSNTIKFMRENIAIIAVLGIMIEIILCIINYYAAAEEDAYRIPLCVHTEVNELGYTTYSGFGVDLKVYESNDTEQMPITDISMYNEEAGNLDNWNNKMNLADFNRYKNDLIQVNGAIIDTELNEDYLIYKFINGEELRVDYVTSLTDGKDYIQEKTDKIKLIHTEEGEDITVNKYEGGLVEIVSVYYIDGEEPLRFREGYYINGMDMFIYATVMMVGNILFVGIAYFILEITLHISKNKNTMQEG